MKEHCGASFIRRYYMQLTHLFLLVCAVLLVLKLIKATAKLMIGAAVITVIVYVVLYVI